MKLSRLGLAAALVCVGLGTAQAAGRGGYTLIVAPARYAVMQVASDIVQRHPAMLVSYQNDTASAEPLLHAWDTTRQEWTHITLQEFREVSFLQKMPARTVLLGDDNVLPAVIKDAAGWSPEVIRVHSLNAAALVNEFGRLLKWPPAEWKWFAARYNLTLNDESEALRKSSWYDQKGPKPQPRGGLLRRSGPAPVESAAPAAKADEPAPAELLPPPAAVPDAAAPAVVPAPAP